MGKAYRRVRCAEIRELNLLCNESDRHRFSARGGLAAAVSESKYLGMTKVVG